MKPPKQRKAEERARLRELGLVPLEVWIPKDKKEELKEYAKELRMQSSQITHDPAPSPNVPV